MKLYAPKYYKDFLCIADRCRHSCCIGWEIDVNKDALQTYTTLSGPYAQTIRESIDMKGIPHFRLTSDERCPHLNAQGLCSIILSCGEDYLCDICREHPRFYNDTPHGREVGLGMACEEACRLILSSDEYADVIEVGECEDNPAGEWDTISMRSALYDLLGDRNMPYVRRLEHIYASVGVNPSWLEDETWRDLLDSLEYMDETHRARFLNYTSNLTTPTVTETVLERALAYFIYRHCTEAEDLADYRVRMGFCLFCERLLCSLIMNDPQGDVLDLARVLSEEIEYSEDNTELIKAMFEELIS